MIYAISKYHRISVKKMNPVLKKIRQKPYLKALQILSYLPRKSARIIENTLKSAVANFTQKYKDSLEDECFIQEAIANQGPYYKRILPCSRGSMNRIQKPLCHLRIGINHIKAKNKKISSKKGN